MANEPSTWSSIAEVEFAGEALCLDFVNTTGNRHSDTPRERLVDLGSWVTFLTRADVFPGQSVVLAEDPDTFAGRELPRLRGFREVLFRIFEASRVGETPAESDLRAFERVAVRVTRARHLRWSDGGFHRDWISDEVSTATGVLRIAESALQVLSSSDRTKLKQCGECDWLFLDLSKNNSRRWCRKTCGDRVKARRYYSNKVKRSTQA